VGGAPHGQVRQLLLTKLFFSHLYQIAGPPGINRYEPATGYDSTSLDARSEITSGRPHSANADGKRDR